VDKREKVVFRRGQFFQPDNPVIDDEIKIQLEQGLVCKSLGTDERKGAQHERMKKKSK
jgi:hypothetical protein